MTYNYKYNEAAVTLCRHAEVVECDDVIIEFLQWSIQVRTLWTGFILTGPRTAGEVAGSATRKQS